MTVFEHAPWRESGPTGPSDRPSLRRGLGIFALGRAASGLLGLAWLLLLTRQLSLSQLGVYFACVALFETLHLSSSLGVYFLAEKRVPVAWVSGDRNRWVSLIQRLAIFRAVTLCIALLALSAMLPTVSRWLGWPAESPGAAVLTGWMLVGGMARLMEVLLECTLQQGFGQSLNVSRNLVRIAVLLALCGAQASADATTILLIECCVGVAYLLVAAVWFTLQWVRATPSAVHAGPLSTGVADRRFALHGWLALLLVQVGGADAIRLAVSISLGPEGLGVYGAAASMVDMLARYMPAALMYGHLRTWLTVQSVGLRSAGREVLRAARLLTRLSGLFALPAVAGLGLFGGNLAILLAPNVKPDLLHAVLAVMAPVLLLQTARLALSLVSHVQGDNRSVLWANLATVPIPALILLAGSSFGVVAAAIGPVLLELVLVCALLHRLQVTGSQLFGRTRYWKSLTWVTLAAAGAGLAAQSLAEPWVAPPLAAFVFGALAFGGLLLGLRPERDERMVLRRVGWK